MSGMAAEETFTVWVPRGGYSHVVVARVECAPHLPPRVMMMDAAAVRLLGEVSDTLKREHPTTEGGLP